MSSTSRENRDPQTEGVNIPTADPGDSASFGTVYAIAGVALLLAMAGACMVFRFFSGCGATNPRSTTAWLRGI